MKKDMKVLSDLMGMVIEDTKKDAKDFDGKPFDGKTVAEYFGNQGAAIAAIAESLNYVIKKIDTKENPLGEISSEKIKQEAGE